MALGVRETLALEPIVSAAKRRYLFLQGPIGPFFHELACGVRALGHQVHRIHFNGGDRVIWRLPGAVDFREAAEAWPAFLAEKLAAWGITDIVLFGDCRPLHREAIRQAHRLNIPVHVFEEGYLRPNWITMELGGVNRNSSLPRSPLWYRDAALSLPAWDEGQAVPRSFFSRAVCDIVHNLGILLLSSQYPHYRTHRPWSAKAEYRAGARRFLLKPVARRRAAQRADQVRAQTQPFFLFPLQLEADTQIRFHSPFGSMAPAIQMVIESFARHAPADTLLVISEHPLDTGVVDQKRVTQAAAEKAGVSERIVYLECGSPIDLIQKARGLVTVNSTVGIQALGFGVPVKVLGDAIYDMAQLSDQQELDSFWLQPQAPHAETFAAFRQVVGAGTQLNGSFFCRPGRRLAVAAAVRKLTRSLATSTRGAQLNLGELDAEGIGEWPSLGEGGALGFLRAEP